MKSNNNKNVNDCISMLLYQKDGAEISQILCVLNLTYIQVNLSFLCTIKVRVVLP